MVSLVKQLPEDVQGQKGFSFAGGRNDEKISGFDASFPRIPDVLFDRYVEQTIVENYSFPIGTVI